MSCLTKDPEYIKKWREMVSKSLTADVIAKRNESIKKGLTKRKKIAYY